MAFFSLYLPPEPVTMRSKEPKDPALNFSHIVDFAAHDGSEIARAILPRTSGRYERALLIFDK